MKAFRYAILLLAGFCLGWGAQSVMRVTLRKAASSRLLLESESELMRGRQALAAYKAREKRFPASVADLYVKGDLQPSDPLVEAFGKSGDWLPEWDGKGGFVYDSSKGSLYLNCDVSREKFLSADWKKVLQGGLFPEGKIN